MIVAKLPLEIRRKRACLRINCEQHESLVYACLASLYILSHSSAGRRLCNKNTYTPYLSSINVTPTTLDDLSLFEKKNPAICLTVLGS